MNQTKEMGRSTRAAAVYLLLAVAFAGLLILNINTGNVAIPPGEIIKILLRGAADPMNANIIFKLRLPRILMAAILGGGLALSGFLLQTFFENPIAGPYVLGISSGAKLTVALTMVWTLKRAGQVSSAGMILSAFAGSFAATAFILLLSRYVQHMASLLVGGIMIGYICSAVTDFVINFADDADIVNLHGWSLGSFSGSKFGNVAVAFCMIGISFLAVFFLAKPIGAFQLGEAYAASMGVNVKVLRGVIILLSSILSASVTAFAGPISFVGIAVPYLVKRLFRTAKPIVVIPGIFLGGSVFCMFCDWIARTVFAPMELNISTVTSLLGAPVVIIMMIGNRRRRYE